MVKAHVVVKGPLRKRVLSWDTSYGRGPGDIRDYFIWPDARNESLPESDGEGNIEVFFLLFLDYQLDYKDIKNPQNRCAGLVLVPASNITYRRIAMFTAYERHWFAGYPSRTTKIV